MKKTAPTQKGEGHELVIAKTLPFSRKLLAKILSTLNEDFAVAETPESARELIDTPRCRIVFADEYMINDDTLKTIREKGVKLVFTTEPEESDRLKDIEYRIYHGKMSAESFATFIKDLRGAQ